MNSMQERKERYKTALNDALATFNIMKCELNEVNAKIAELEKVRDNRINSLGELLGVIIDTQKKLTELDSEENKEE